MDTVVLVAKRATARSNHKVRVVSPKNSRGLSATAPTLIEQSRFAANDGQTFDYRLSDAGASVVARLLSTFSALEHGFELGVGINTGFIRDELVSDRKIDSRYHRMVPGSGISRYGAVVPAGWILYDAEYVRSRGKLGRSLPPEESLVAEDRYLSQDCVSNKED